MKKIYWIFLALLVIYGVVCLAAYLLQEKIMFHPEPLPQNFHYHPKTLYSEHFLTTKDGKAHINMVWLKAKQPKGVLVYSHGNAGNLDRWANLVSDFTDLGYDVMVYDYRTYGKSTGELSEQNLFDDAQLVYNFAMEHFAEQQIICYGRSLGTGIAAYLAANNSPKYLILETPYFSFLDIVDDYGFGWLPARWLLKYTLRTDLRLGDVRCPITVFHGTADEVVPYESGAKLKALLKSNDQFITIPNGRHNNLVEFKEFREVIALILAK